MLPVVQLHGHQRAEKIFACLARGNKQVQRQREKPSESEKTDREEEKEEERTDEQHVQCGTIRY